MAEGPPDLAVVEADPARTSADGSDSHLADAEEELWVETQAVPTGSGLTTPEIFDCLRTNLRQAAEEARQLAWHPRRGPLYLAMCRHVGLAEGACRQAAVHREDARWLTLGMALSGVPKRAGRWVRGMPSRAARVEAHRLFLKLGETLDKMAYDFDQLRDMATGRIGMILPEPPPVSRETRPVSVRLPSGLIVPSSYH